MASKSFILLLYNLPDHLNFVLRYHLCLNIFHDSSCSYTVNLEFYHYSHIRSSTSIYLDIYKPSNDAIVERYKARVSVEAKVRLKMTFEENTFKPHVILLRNTFPLDRVPLLWPRVQKLPFSCIQIYRIPVWDCCSVDFGGGRPQ